MSERTINRITSILLLVFFALSALLVFAHGYSLRGRAWTGGLVTEQEQVADNKWKVTYKFETDGQSYWADIYTTEARESDKVYNLWYNRDDYTDIVEGFGMAGSFVMFCWFFASIAGFGYVAWDAIEKWIDGKVANTDGKSNCNGTVV